MLDDLNFHLRSIENWQDSHGHLSERELDTDQVGMVFDLVVRRHPAFGNFRVTHDGRIGWAQKRPSLRQRIHVKSCART